jgi:hypothetical protein
MDNVTLFEAVDLAREMTEPPPEPPNQEYVRGQAELICDMFCLPMKGWRDVIIAEISKGRRSTIAEWDDE